MICRKLSRTSYKESHSLFFDADNVHSRARVGRRVTGISAEDLQTPGLANEVVRIHF